MKKTSCCFTGHRDMPKDLLPIRKRLKAEIISAIDKGYTDFYVGGAIGFDTLAAKVLLELRMEGYSIKVHLIYPFDGFTDKFPAKDKAVYDTLLPKFDTVTCASKARGKEGFYKRNRCLVDVSSHCIAYMTKEQGGTAYTFNYAISQGCTVINIAKP
ncbi:MAG: DUF1273 family protein [Oscillospiraceae bacterium]|nr:DUF1273 family protein [Oscillospiraceae bacterium]